MNKGKFITFEGGEGSGKSTQITFLCDYLEKNKVPFILTREPGGTPVSEAIRNILLNPDFKGMNYVTEVLLFLASRKQHIDEKIKPSLEKAKIILCDRYHDSTIAYQSGARDLNNTPFGKIISNIYDFFDCVPDRTYFFDIPAKEGLIRVKKRRNKDKNLELESRIDDEELGFHQNVRKAYLKLAEQEPDRIVVVDGTKSIEEIHEIIKKDIINYLQINL